MNKQSTLDILAQISALADLIGEADVGWTSQSRALALLTEAGGEAHTWHYEDGRAIDAVYLDLAGRRFRASSDYRPMTEEECAAHAALARE